MGILRSSKNVIFILLAFILLAGGFLLIPHAKAAPQTPADLQKAQQLKAREDVASSQVAAETGETERAKAEQAALENPENAATSQAAAEVAELAKEQAIRRSEAANPALSASPIPSAQNTGAAENTNVTSGSGWSRVLGWIVNPIAGAIIDGFVALAELARNAIFAGPVLIVTLLFDLAVWINIKMNILKNGAVIQVWGVMQGVTNMFFILILLWIAISTILDFEEYTAKRLFSKLVVAAILVNFSLTLTTMLVDFSNAMALGFYNSITKNDPLFISLMNGLSINRFTNIETQIPAGLAQDQQIRNISVAADPLKGLGGQTEPNVKLGEDTVKKQLAANFYNLSSLKGSLARLVALFITTIVAIIFIFVMLFGVGFLLARTVTFIFLGVLSPLAFLASVMPQTQTHWKEWLTKATQQAFFAPAYLFCLFVALKLMEAAKGDLYARDNNAQVSAFDPGFIFYYLVASGLLIGALIVAQKMGIALGGTAVGLANKAGSTIKKELAKSAKETGAHIAVGPSEKFLKTKTAATLSRIPILRNIPLAATKIQEVDQKRAAERAQLYAQISPSAFYDQFGKLGKVEQEAYYKATTANKREDLLELMAERRGFAGTDPSIIRGLMKDTKSFIPDAELAARGIYKGDPNYGQSLKNLITEKWQDLRRLSFRDLKRDTDLARAFKSVARRGDLESLAGAPGGMEAITKLFESEINEASQINLKYVPSGPDVGNIIQRDYGNTDLANYISYSPAFAQIIAGQVVRPRRRQGRQPGGGTQP